MMSPYFTMIGHESSNAHAGGAPLHLSYEVERHQHLGDVA
jgi:hypothetical protein